MLAFESVKLRYFVTHGEMVKAEAITLRLLEDNFAPKHVNGVSWIEKFEM